jgi:pSer/pThr/pTyr-binding forkhead associated (FHA) protein
MWALTVVFCGGVLDEPRRVLLRQGTQILGRQGTAAIDDPAVSRRHVAIDVHGDALDLRDLGSRSGTRVNGAPITACRLGSGDVISLGDTLAIVELPMSGGGHVHLPSPTRTRSRSERARCR